MRQILIVDDEEMVRNFLSQVFGNEGYAVTVANDCHTAKSLLARHHYHIVILDVSMPVMSGTELAKFVPPDTPILYNSGHLEKNLDGFHRRSIDGYITKPYIVATIKKEVEDLLNKTMTA